jgi:hypothetical protein
VDYLILGNMAIRWLVGEENGCPTNTEKAVDQDHRTILTQAAVAGDVLCA